MRETLGDNEDLSRPKKFFRALGKPMVSVTTKYKEHRKERAKVLFAEYVAKRLAIIDSVIEKSTIANQAALRAIRADLSIPRDADSHGGGADVFPEDGGQAYHEWVVFLKHGPDQAEQNRSMRRLAENMALPLGSLYFKHPEWQPDGAEVEVKDMIITCTADYSSDGNLDPARTRLSINPSLLHNESAVAGRNQSIEISLGENGTIDNFAIADGKTWSLYTLSPARIETNVTSLLEHIQHVAEQTAQAYRLPGDL